MASKAQVEIIMKTIDKTSKQMNTISSASKRMSKSMKSAGESMKAFGAKSRAVGANLTRSVTLPILALGGVAVKIYADFDKTLTNIEARTGATAAQMEKIRKVAINMGRDTAFSATQAGEALLELMSSGSSVEEAISTLPHVLNLASAGQIELGRSSDIVTDILAQFGEGVERAEDVVDSLAAGAQSSSADIESLAQGMAKIGPIAKNFGISFEQTTAILAVFAENGIKGAEAGTQMRSMLTAMSSQTKRAEGAWKRLNTSMFDAAGNVKDIDTIIDEVNRGLTSMTEQQRIATIQDLAGSFGQMGLSALLASNGIDTMLTKMSRSQTAAQVAKKQMESFSGAVNQLKGSLQTFAIVVIGPFVEKYLQPLVAWLTKGLNAFTDLATRVPAVGTTIVALGIALAVIGPTLWAIGAAAGVFGTMVTGISAVTTAVGFLTGSAIPTLIAGITGTLIPAMMAATSAASAMAASMWAAGGPIAALIAALVLLGLTIKQFGPEALNTVKTIGLILEASVKQFFNLFKMLGIIIIKGGQKLLGAALQIGANIVIGIIKGIASVVETLFNVVKDIATGVVNVVQGIFGIASPSKVMTTVGNNLGLSLVGGFADGVGRGMQQVGPGISKAFGGFGAAGGGGGARDGGGSFLDRFKQVVSSPDFGQADKDLLLAALGVGGGASAIPAMAATGGGGNVSITINELNVPPGTPKEEVDYIWDEISKRVNQRGLF